jgi:hypothetical protein
LQITSSPSGASVYFDGKLKGTTPLTLTGLSPGPHEILLSRAGSKDYAAPVPIAAGQTTLLDAQLASEGGTGTGTGTVSTLSAASGTGTLIISSTPAGANVYIDGEQSGTTPVTVQNVNAGTHRVLLTLQGYSDISRTITLSTGGQEAVTGDFTGKKGLPGFGAGLCLIVLVLAAVLVHKNGR